MKNHFSQTQFFKPKRNYFDLSHTRSFSMNAGELVPCMVKHCLPGETTVIKNEHLTKLEPLVSSPFTRITQSTLYFAVPYRLLWANWREFITMSETVQPVMPFITINGGDNKVIESYVLDYLGLPPTYFNLPTDNIQVNALTPAAYCLVWNDWFMDQNLQQPKDAFMYDGDVSTQMAANGIFGRCFKVAWASDYFTRALPWPQKGSDTYISLGTFANIVYDNPDELVTRLTTPESVDGTDDLEFDGDLFTGNGSTAGHSSMLYGDSADNRYANVNNAEQLKADLSTASAVTINALRSAFAIQSWKETTARGGSRYIEQIFVHFGVKSSDARLQRSEYLGGYKSVVGISDVVQVSESQSTPQGNIAGKGTAAGQSNTITHYSEEHEVIIGVTFIIPDATYSQGIDKFWMRKQPFDFPFPVFAHLGEQEVKNHELFVQGTQEDYETFAYQERYAEERFIPSTIHGNFRGSRNSWVWDRNFGTLPQFNEAFISCNPDYDPFAVTSSDEQHFYVHMVNFVLAKKPLPLFGIPSNLQ